MVPLSNPNNYSVENNYIFKLVLTFTSDISNPPPLTKLISVDGLRLENKISGPMIHNKITVTKVQPIPHFANAPIFNPIFLSKYVLDYIFEKNNNPCMSSNLNHYQISNAVSKNVQSIKTFNSNKNGMA